MSLLFIEKYLSTTDLIYTSDGKLLRALCFCCGTGCPTAPLSAAILLGALGQTRFTLPYHVFGEEYELMTPTSLSLLTIDWAIISVGLLSFYAVFFIGIDAVIRITLICKALR